MFNMSWGGGGRIWLARQFRCVIMTPLMRIDIRWRCGNLNSGEYDRSRRHKALQWRYNQCKPADANRDGMVVMA